MHRWLQIQSLPLQIFAFALYTNYRATLFSVLSVYNARCFGPSNVGRLHGLAFTLASLGCFAIYPI
eukprot:SAG11_NODE_26130_length_349_cov_1.020000_1_plen_65_part_10